MILKIYTSHHRKACTKNACFFEKLVHGKPQKHKKEKEPKRKTKNVQSCICSPLYTTYIVP